ncbi:hypothetical protein DSLASN_48030 [Desulfoluna limicola]|uniref:Uncharacterized protein n=1 Tax=Desulfoluna limicola TaxID=2810562 RepID=A0ABM7PPR1_9BACT|nr:hypothetical protein [Desulfoluna limicola]BCS99171.1 hypothetical protein DSLASN_48030 [Desulfoluna limicola]
MHIYGLHDAKRAITTILPLTKFIIGYIALTLFLDIFFSGIRSGSEMKGPIVAHFALSTCLSYIVMSFFLGRLIELIFNLRPLPALGLIRKHLPGYLLATLLLVLLVTPVFMVLSAIFFPQNHQALFYTILVTLKILPIYVFPLVFITGQAKHAVFTGIKCLAGNVSDSLFLIFLSTLVFLFDSYLVPALLPAIGNSPAANALIVTCNICFSLYIFTAATWVMKEKIYSDEGPEGHMTVH